jgi:hypothetical protein
MMGMVCALLGWVDLLTPTRNDSGQRRFRALWNAGILQEPHKKITSNSSLSKNTQTGIKKNSSITKDALYRHIVLGMPRAQKILGVLSKFTYAARDALKEL